MTKNQIAKSMLGSHTPKTHHPSIKSTTHHEEHTLCGLLVNTGTRAGKSRSIRDKKGKTRLWMIQFRSQMFPSMSWRELAPHSWKNTVPPPLEQGKVKNFTSWECSIASSLILQAVGLWTTGGFFAPCHEEVGLGSSVLFAGDSTLEHLVTKTFLTPEIQSGTLIPG